MDPRHPHRNATQANFRNPRHPRQNFDPRHRRLLFDTRQNVMEPRYPSYPRQFFDPRHPRHPRQSLTHAIHEPTHSRYLLQPRNHVTYVTYAIQQTPFLAAFLHPCAVVQLDTENKFLTLGRPYILTRNLFNRKFI